VSRRIEQVQDRFAALLGCKAEARESVVEGMLRRDPGEVTGYWLQLGVAVGIASLGLVLGSTAVVIGAMLIAPLMSPIVRLGMGLAVGSPFLVLRSSGRIVASIGFALACSSGLTVLLPFHETTPEIASRTAPTVLDLLTAAFCALAGAYASMRPNSDVASTAAGTSIGISLVPPLCASGYGIGTGVSMIANGAGLLFLTNLVAIVVVASLTFAAAGFNQVDSQTLEREELGSGNGARLARVLAAAFASRGGSWLRLAMPIALLCVVYVPLRQALDDLVWQVKVRSAVESALAKLPSRVVQSSMRIQRGQVSLGLLLLGSTAEAQRSQAMLTDLLQHAGIQPELEIAAVPDARSFARLEAKMRTPAAQPVPIIVDALADFDSGRKAVWDAVQQRWPERAVGRLLSVALETSTQSTLALRIMHLGPDLDAGALELLARVVSDDLRRAVTIDRSVGLPVDARVFDPTPTALANVALLVEAATKHLSVSTCVTRPEPTTAKRQRTRSENGFDAEMLALLARRPRTVLQIGERWSVRFGLGPCDPPATPGGM
jgi:uncharacterized hydrophobic protein (TIGR00271 family)